MNPEKPSDASKVEAALARPAPKPLPTAEAVEDLLAEIEVWKHRFTEERERLGKLWVAYVSLESRLATAHAEVAKLKEAKMPKADAKAAPKEEAPKPSA